MERLCFKPDEFETDNEIDTDGDKKSGRSSGSFKARIQKMLLLLSVLITLLAAFVGGSLTALFQASESSDSAWTFVFIESKKFLKFGKDRA